MSENEGWDQEWLANLHAQIDHSHVFLTLFSESYKENPTTLVQLVYAMMLEKPIYIVVEEGTKIPKGFKKMADGIEYFKTKEDIDRAVNKILKESILQ